MSQFPDRYELLAASYLLNQCSEEERLECEQLLVSDPLFAALVEDMEKTLAPLNKAIPFVEPPADLFDDIMREIENAPKLHVFANERRYWKPLALAASLIATVSLAYHSVTFFQPERNVPVSDLMAMMAQQNDDGLIVVVYDPERNRIVARLNDVSAPEAGVWQLWRIRTGADAPTSLGVLPMPSEDGRLEFQLNQQLAPQGDTLAISLEPQGGSTQPGPSGPVLFIGEVDPV